MAQKTVVHLVDDLDGSEAQETVSFSLDGTGYEIDLNDDHAGQLRGALAPYVGSARKSGGRAGGRRGSGQPAGAGRSSGRASSSDRQRSSDIRRWAREQGIEVNERGRIPQSVVERYDAAH